MVLVAAEEQKHASATAIYEEKQNTKATQTRSRTLNPAAKLKFPTLPREMDIPMTRTSATREFDDQE